MCVFEQTHAVFCSYEDPQLYPLVFWAWNLPCVPHFSALAQYSRYDVKTVTKKFSLLLYLARRFRSVA